MAASYRSQRVTTTTPKRAVGALRDARKPTILSQPAGANFHLDGHEVTWGKCAFTPVWTRGSHGDLDRSLAGRARPPRSMLYQGYLSEIFVAYMDTDYGGDRGPVRYRRSARAARRRGWSRASIARRPPAFCPPSLVTTRGSRSRRPNALCVSERGGGGAI